MKVCKHNTEFAKDLEQPKHITVYHTICLNFCF